jgi:ElaB/YqjD/DUF883 family membrane-anchored ribosome-binding protein
MATKKKGVSPFPQAETLKTGFAETRDRIQTSASKTADNARTTIRKRPLTTVGAAAGAAAVAGVVAGAVLARRASNKKKR